MSELDRQLELVKKTFESAFGATPLHERVADIQSQVTAIDRFRDATHLRQKTGDLLSSLLQLCNESDWIPSELVAATLERMEFRTEICIKQGREVRGGLLGGVLEPYRMPATTELVQEQRQGDTSASPCRRRIAVYASTFDPPSNFHREEVATLLNSGFDEVIIYPTSARPQRGEYENAAPLHRAAITSLAFRDLKGVTVDYTDLSSAQFSSPCELELRFAGLGEIWHVVHYSMVKRDEKKLSIVDSHWDGGDKLWQNSNFAILHAPDSEIDVQNIPPQHQLIQAPDRPASEELRARVYRGESLADCVDADVAAYIQRHRLFRPDTRQRQATFRVDRPKLLIVSDEMNSKSVEIAKKYARCVSNSPNLVLVLGGDGTMLRAIREHWRLRVPFVGLNTGHLGFLMNERLPDELHDLELVSYSLPMLRIDAKKPDGEQSWGLAYTDVWLERAEGQAAWLRVDVDGETRVSKVVGDGMLIATAAGSSAYARAMGAVPVPIDTPTLTLAGSNIFQPRFWKPMILSDDSRITISSLDYSGKRPLRGFIDGSPLGAVQEISVRRSLTASVELAFTKEFDPSARLLRTLFPPDEL